MDLVIAISRNSGTEPGLWVVVVVDLTMVSRRWRARYRRVLDDDHPSTLLSASSLAADLRALGETEDGSGT